MKKFIALLSLVSFIQCGSSDKKNVSEIIATGTLEEIQLQKTAHVKTINQLEKELEQLNASLQSKDKTQKFVLVGSVELKEEFYQHSVSFQGSIETDKNILIYPEIPGLLKKIHVSEGQKVTQGTLLAEISDGGLRDQLEQLKLQLKLAKTTFERQQRLWKQKIGSEIQFLQAKTNYLSIEKSVSQMKDQVAKTKITAPFDGVIDHIVADRGSNLTPGMTPIIRIINLDQMKVAAEIPEIHLPNIHTNTSAVVSVPVLGTQYEERVSVVGNFINPNNRSFRVEISLDNKEQMLKPNMTALIEVNDYNNPKAVLVSIKNILENQAGASYVYKLVEEDAAQNTYRVEKTFVKLGKSSNNKVEILSGLQAGDRIVEDGIRLVKDQQLVKNI
ncbi:efflux RND transporter periplasmic adaptor subunit [Flavobacteriaceae bacterium]|nr:efflux RND transporter periplasmic adaptor subunit [Flavobacteriaceae bacterium]MDB4153230.1 efflux RND transporter periplasmic adaptor subunit [Flavobacteriaceae bacterium]MDB9989071.1 efflux RND transporter periplasmic adaptor subunit [Flavobacteriaceae bacterium]MDC1439181.1 efflux RND transporter periplasmic adaptor subunit [Flavobacteriaceae bacterium]|tara:strand:- start:476 stop:1639 length:1164 start_codon:yes stop_codon:yes gene_type:complete